MTQPNQVFVPQNVVDALFDVLGYELVPERTTSTTPKVVRMLGRVRRGDEALYRLFDIAGVSPDWSFDLSVHVWREFVDGAPMVRYGWRLIFQSRTVPIATYWPDIARLLRRLQETQMVESQQEIEVPINGAPPNRNQPNGRGKGAWLHGQHDPRAIQANVMGSPGAR